MARAFADFTASLNGMKKLVALAASAITPVVAAFAGVSPPWPPGVTKLSVVLVTLVLVLAWPTVSATTPVRRRRLILFAAVTCLVFLFAYLALFSVFVFNVPTSAKVVIVLGCGYTEDARKVAAFAQLDEGFGCPGNYERLLQSAQFVPGEIWTRWSIVAVQAAIFASWLLTLSSLSVALFAFASGQQAPAPKAGARTRVPRSQKSGASD
jgi:hypothetical protein